MPATIAEPPAQAILLAGEAGHRTVLGDPILLWQARAVRAAGVGRLILVGPRLAEPLASRIMAAGLAVQHAAAPAALAPLLAGDVLLLAEGLLLDPRALRQFLALAHAPALLEFAHWEPPGAERIDRSSLWAGALLLPSAMVADTLQGLGDWDLAATLLRVGDAGGARRVAMESLDLPIPDDPDRRLPMPLAWAKPADASAAEQAGRQLLAAAVPPGPDFADRLLHWPVAGWLGGWLCGTPLCGRLLCRVALALILAALLLFASGLAWPGLALLLLSPVLHETGRLLLAARGGAWPRAIPPEAVRTTLSALAVASLAPSVAAESLAAWLVAGGLVLFTALRAGLLGWYRRRTGGFLDQRGRPEAWLAGLSGASTSLAWPLVPFALAGQWWPGLLLLAGIALLLFLLVGWRLLLAIDSALPQPRQ